MVESDVQRAIRRFELAIVGRAPYEEVIALLDACAALPDAKRAELAIAGWRVTAALHYNRPAQECEAALIRYLALDSTLDRRATEILAVCADHAELARRYLPQLIPQLISAVEAAPRDRTIAEILNTAYALRDEHLGPAPADPDDEQR